MLASRDDGQSVDRNIVSKKDLRQPITVTTIAGAKVELKLSKGALVREVKEALAEQMGFSTWGSQLYIIDDIREEDDGDLELKNWDTISTVLRSCKSSTVLDLSVILRPDPETLEDMIGPMVERSWTEDFALATEEGMAALNQSLKQYPYLANAKTFHDTMVSWGNHRARVQVGFTHEEAEIIDLLCVAAVNAAIGKAISEKSDRFAALTYAVYNVLAKKGAEGHVAEACYFHLRGKGIGLADLDERWEHILDPDENGFRGMTTHGPLMLNAPSSYCFSEAGLKANLDRTWHIMDSPVVRFLSEAPEDHGNVLHSAIKMSNIQHVIPPLTQLEVVSVEDGPFEYRPEGAGGGMINQKLITVRLTYLLTPVHAHLTPYSSAEDTGAGACVEADVEVALASGPGDGDEAGTGTGAGAGAETGTEANRKEYV